MKEGLDHRMVQAVWTPHGGTISVTFEITPSHDTGGASENE